MDETQVTGTDAPVQDTAPIQSNEADVQVNEAPEAAQVEEPTVNATDTVEDKLYAGKYKSVEDMEKAYSELQSKFTTTASEKAELSKILNEAFAEPIAQAPVQPDVYADEIDPVNQEIDNLKRQTAVQGFIMNHQDADAVTMQKILTTDPLVRQISGHEAKLEYAYLRSQNMVQSKTIAEAQKTGAQQAQAKIAEKQVAQVETAQASKPTENGAELYNVATGNYSQAERDQARMALIRKNLINL